MPLLCENQPCAIFCICSPNKNLAGKEIFDYPFLNLWGGLVVSVIIFLLVGKIDCLGLCLEVSLSLQQSLKIKESCFSGEE